MEATPNSNGRTNGSPSKQTDSSQPTSGNPIDNLAVVANLYSSANKLLREAIQKRDDEIGRLEQFEGQFRAVKESFAHYKEMAVNHNLKSDELHNRLNYELNKQRKSIDDLKIQIDRLQQEISEQKGENKRLEAELKESAGKLEYNNDNTYANAFPIVLSPNSFIQRLCEDTE